MNWRGKEFTRNIRILRTALNWSSSLIRVVQPPGNWRWTKKKTKRFKMKIKHWRKRVELCSTWLDWLLVLCSGGCYWPDAPAAAAVFILSIDRSPACYPSPKIYSKSKSPAVAHLSIQPPLVLHRPQPDWMVSTQTISSIENIQTSKHPGRIFSV